MEKHNGVAAMGKDDLRRQDGLEVVKENLRHYFRNFHFFHRVGVCLAKR